MNETQIQERPSALEMEPLPVGAMTRPASLPGLPPRRQDVLPSEKMPTPAVESGIFKSSDQVNDLFGALAKAQTAFSEIERTLTAKIESQRAKYAYAYAPLSEVLKAVRPELAKNAIAFMQFPHAVGKKVTLRTTLGHASGQWISNELTMEAGDFSPQSIGSAISYLRRYAAQAVLGVAAEEDDDGAAASRPAPRQEPASSAAPARSDMPKPAPRTAAPNGQPSAEQTRSGKIADLTDYGARGVLVVLEGGFSAGGKDPEIAAALRRHHSNGVSVELTTRPSSDPAKFAPIVTEVCEQRREAGQEG